MKDYKRINELKLEANSPKTELMKILDELYRIGANREANSLSVIIEKLELWQNK